MYRTWEPKGITVKFTVAAGTQNFQPLVNVGMKSCWNFCLSKGVCLVRVMTQRKVMEMAVGPRTTWFKTTLNQAIIQAQTSTKVLTFGRK